MTRHALPHVLHVCCLRGLAGLTRRLQRTFSTDTFSLELVCESDGVQDYEFMAALLVFYARSSWRKPYGLAMRELEAMSVETLRKKAAEHIKHPVFFSDTMFRGRLDSLSQGPGSRRLAGYTDIMQISADQCSFRFVVIVKEPMQSCESLIGMITVIISNRQVADTSRDTAPGRVATRFISCSLTPKYQSRCDRLSEPKLAAATKRQDYKLFST
ncbi:hypothetical protein B0H14DRAFT_3134604 [Mycena olivaceomarginata]|nr:hypothetical protein B0H14DRAFT_3134604 [Mycena olivaceomarginata]